MAFLTTFTGYAAPIFLIASPFLSYGDQALTMHRTKSSAGFSLDIPLIMLVASILRFALSRPPCRPLPPLHCVAPSRERRG